MLYSCFPLSSSFSFGGILGSNSTLYLLVICSVLYTLKMYHVLIHLRGLVKRKFQCYLLAILQFLVTSFFLWHHDLEKQGADFTCHAVTTPAIPPTLPPSVEEAYKKKCIELKRRLNEVEESNDVYRLRKVRLLRGIRKMRLERAFLLEILGKRMRKNGSGGNGPHGFYDEESEGSSEGPPTVC